MMSAWAVMLIGLMAIEGMEAPAKKITAEAITKKMQQRIDKVEGLSAEFSISTYMAALNQHRESSGQLYILRKKSKLRLEQADQTIVSDGKSVWTYIPVNQQIIVMPAEASKAGIRPDEFLFFYTSQYTHTLIGDEMIDGVVHYKLHLKANTVLADFPELRIWVDSREWLTRRVLYADDMGSETVVQFTHIRLNPDMPSGTFTMSAPEGVEVVDLR
ncbi:MAG: outer membrane lipoprotein carrier protein LolA [Gemmatimonadota bacterium]|nr:outer membrane lipoprotein carrier protein LolA [Gemmatimonadota bacterium]